MFAIERFNRRWQLMMRGPVRGASCLAHEGGTADYRHGGVIAALS